MSCLHDSPATPLMSPSELAQVLAALRGGRAVVHFRDPEGSFRIVELGGSPVTIGRRSDCSVALSWDASVSRIHAQLHALASEWVLDDDGLSRNGTYVNGERVTSKRLADGDVVLVGSTVLSFRAPDLGGVAETRANASGPGQVALTPAQQRVLEALCRPMVHEGRNHGPASNRQIAEELFLGVETVKTHMRALAELFSVGHLPQTHRRHAIVENALRWGLVRS